MRFAELVGRSRLLLAAAILLQWLSTLVVALRAEHVSLGAVELLNVVVLGPLALVCAYRVAAHVGGTALGSWTLLVWVAAPWLVEALTLGSYGTTVQDRVLPLVLGLTNEPGYSSGVALLAAVALLASPGSREAAAAGVATGVGILLVPEALVFLVPASVALLADWRRRELGTFLLAAAPAILVVSLWRQPAFGELTLEALQANFGGLREYFFSQRLIQWLPVAGAIAVGRRSVPLALLLGGWFGAWVATGATRVGIGFENGEVVRVLLPALPACVLLAAALPLLVPTLATRLGALARPVES
jgi:hypothetical protein